MQNGEVKAQNAQDDSVISISVAVVLMILLAFNGITTYLGMCDAIQAGEWIQKFFIAFITVATMFYVACLRLLNNRFSELKGYRSFVFNLGTPCFFILFFVVDTWSTFESLKKYFVKNIEFQHNLLALLILVTGTLVCVSAPILIAFYNDIKKNLL